MTIILRYFAKFGSFSYVKAIKVRPILSTITMLFKEFDFRQYMIYGHICRDCQEPVR